MVERLATISDGDDTTLEGCYSMNDCYLQALSQAPCAHPQVYVSELPSAASVSLATHPHQPSNTMKYYWSHPVRRPPQEQLRAFQIPESSWSSHIVVFSQAGYFPVVLLRPGHQFLQLLL